MYLLYSFLLTISFLILSPRFLFDAATKGKYAEGFWQRFGRLPKFETNGKPVVWLHCVSVGETNAAKPLVKALLENFPEYRLVVSTTTKTGQKLAGEIFGKDAALVFYFPFDWRFVVRRVLRQLKPKVVLIMETELWFNFLREAKKQNIKIALVNGRLSEKSFKNYSLIRGFMQRVLTNLDSAVMSGEADAERIVSLGCRPDKVFVAGNVKFDLETNHSENDLTEYFRNRFAIEKKRPLIVAASTHAPEENWILAAFDILRRQFSDAAPRLIIVPRHPERFDAVAKSAEKNAFKFALRSAAALKTDVEAEIILLDSIGELRGVLPLAEIVFVGGSLIPHGGQNILEPAAAGRAVVTGFYTANFASIVRELLARNALVQLPELAADEIPARLAEVFARLLRNETERENLAANAVAVVRANGGATLRTIEKLRPLFPK